MPLTDEPATFQNKGAAADRRKPGATTTEPPATPDLVALTVDAATGRIVKVERVDDTGQRHEISEEDRTRLAKGDAKATLQQVVEQAFEAGIDCVLRGGDEEEAATESDEDGELSRLLLRSLIQRSAAKRLIGREVLSRAIVGTLVEQAAAFRAASAESTAPH